MKKLLVGAILFATLGIAAETNSEAGRFRLFRRPAPRVTQPAQPSEPFTRTNVYIAGGGDGTANAIATEEKVAAETSARAREGGYVRSVAEAYHPSSGYAVSQSVDDRRPPPPPPVSHVRIPSYGPIGFTTRAISRAATLHRQGHIVELSGLYSGRFHPNAAYLGRTGSSW